MWHGFLPILAGVLICIQDNVGDSEMLPETLKINYQRFL